MFYLHLLCVRLTCILIKGNVLTYLLIYLCCFLDIVRKKKQMYRNYRNRFAVTTSRQTLSWYSNNHCRYNDDSCAYLYLTSGRRTARGHGCSLSTELIRRWSSLNAGRRRVTLQKVLAVNLTTEWCFVIVIPAYIVDRPTLDASLS